MHAPPSTRPRRGLALPACVLAACLGAASTPAAAAPGDFTVVNDARDDIVALWIAEPGSERWRRIEPGADAVDAGTEAAFDLPSRGAGHCVRDVRFEFSRGAALVHRGLDVCRHARYRPGPQRLHRARSGAG